jgi:hypothetical protein
MKGKTAITLLFSVAALYDGVLGVVFLFNPLLAFRLFDVTPPNHVGYVQFPAALLIVFALLFLSIARRPIERWHLIPYGIGLKISYCGIVFWHWLRTDIPFMWKPFAVADLLFLALFFWAWGYLVRLRD